METGNNIMEERLWSYIDGVLPAGEQTVIEQLIQSDAAWKASYHELLGVHQLLQSSELEAPSLRFTKNVMEEISRLSIAPASKKYINKKIIWGISFFFIALFTGFLIYGLGQMDWKSGQPSDISKTLSQFDISKFFSSSWVNAFMMINIILGLFLLDNYFSKKRKEYRREANS